MDTPLFNRKLLYISDKTIPLGQRTPQYLIKKQLKGIISRDHFIIEQLRQCDSKDIRKIRHTITALQKTKIKPSIIPIKYRKLLNISSHSANKLLSLLHTQRLPGKSIVLNVKQYRNDFMPNAEKYGPLDPRLRYRVIDAEMALLKLLKGSRSIKHLTLQYDNNEIYWPLVRLLFNASHSQLTEFKLESINNSLLPMEEEPMQLSLMIFCYFITRMNKLTFLDTQLPNNIAYEQQSLTIADLIFKRLNNLEVLKLKLDDDMEISQLFKNSLHSIKSLKIQSLSSRISGLGFLNISDNLIQAPNLEHLSLCLNGIEKATEPTIEAFNDYINSLAYITSLTITMNQFSKSDKNKLQSIFSCFSELEDLTDLNLNLSNIPLSKFSVSILSKCISNQQNLKKLSITMQNCFVSDLDISLLGNEIAKAKEIEEIHLNLSRNSEIMSSGMNDLFQGIKQLKCIRKLTMNFQRIPKLVDKSIQSLNEILAHNMYNIEQLHLEVQGSHYFTDNYMLQFAQCVRNLQNLKDFKFMANDCVSISTKSIAKMLYSLGSKKHLSDVNIKVIDCFIEKSNLRALQDVIQELSVKGAIEIVENKKIDSHMIEYHSNKISPFKSPEYSPMRTQRQLIKLPGQEYGLGHNGNSFNSGGGSNSGYISQSPNVMRLFKK